MNRHNGHHSGINMPDLAKPALPGQLGNKVKKQIQMQTTT